MLSPRARFLAAAVLFAGWVLYLGFLAATAARPVVLSRPQFLVSDLYVIATVDGDADAPRDVVTVVVAGGPGAGRTEVRPGANLRVGLLGKAGKDQGWAGPGEYVLPLTRLGDGSYHLTTIPRSPGYAADALPLLARVRIYEATSATRRQLDDIRFAPR